MTVAARGQQRLSALIGLAVLVLAAGGIAGAGERAAIPAAVAELLTATCLDCHSGDGAEAGVALDGLTIDWGDARDRDLWRRVAEVVENRRMPPADAPALEAADRAVLLGFLEPALLAHTPFGGTGPRRLGRIEYETTLRRLLNLPSFELPPGFPNDPEVHGFDNLAVGLAISPAHLEAYATTAGEVADTIFPPPRAGVRSLPGRWHAGPEDMALSLSAATVHGDALRLVSRSGDMKRSCTWPSRIVAQDSGTYTITISASKFLTPEGHAFAGPMRLEVFARPAAGNESAMVKNFRLLHTIEVTAESPAATTFTADLYEDETLLVRWVNAELTHEPDALADLMEAWFRDDPRLLAAWQEAVFPDGKLVARPDTSRLRGRNGWNIVTRLMADPGLDLADATMDSAKTRGLLAVCRSLKGTFEIADAMCHFYHDNGPALEIHGITVEGPSQPVESPRDKARTAARLAVTGPRLEGQSDAEFTRAMLERFLPRAFRRPVSAETVEEFLAIATGHMAAGHSCDEALHLVLRSILVSPRFLYRDLEPADAAGRLDAFDLATRLSSFLTLGPPDDRLSELAASGRLLDPDVLRAEAARLMPRQAIDPMIESFVGQWLDTRLLAGLMPDEKFKVTVEDIRLAGKETKWFFAEILRDNLPLATFIDPDFTWSSVDFCENYYRITPRYPPQPPVPLTVTPGVFTQADAERAFFRRLDIDRGGRHGGLLGQAAILMVTANGVDTQPVIRGVWVLENILGMPPPPPPKDVPALTPDTRAAKTPRELLAAHTAEASCAVCHRQIDPLGFVLEPYDPVGRWRTTWPGNNTPIDATATLPDGTVVSGPVELKAWLVDNIDLFAACLAEKLATFATGRVPNYAERHELRTLARAACEPGRGFQDLVLDLIDSRTFRSR